MVWWRREFVASTLAALGSPSVQAAAPNPVGAATSRGSFAPATVGVLSADGDRRIQPVSLGIQGLDSVAGSLAWPVFERLFREYGLPEAIRSDNGSPFASASAVARLSHLSVQWVKLGIRLERIRTRVTRSRMGGMNGCTGRSSRRPRARRPRAGRPNRSASTSFEASTISSGLTKRLASRLRETFTALPSDRIPRRSCHRTTRGTSRCARCVPTGGIKWQGEFLFLSEALSGERVGLEETADGVWTVYFGPLLLARFDEKDRELYG